MIRRLLEVPAETAEPADVPPDQPPRCPHCGEAALYTVGRIARPRVSDIVVRTYGPNPFDTS